VDWYGKDCVRYTVSSLKKSGLYMSLKREIKERERKKRKKREIGPLSLTSRWSNEKSAVEASCPYADGHNLSAWVCVPIERNGDGGGTISQSIDRYCVTDRNQKTVGK